LSAFDIGGGGDSDRCQSTRSPCTVHDASYVLSALRATTE
jgi:hypothetical protein